MSENMILWEALRQVPGEAKKKIFGGRLKGMTDIKPQWRIKIMTEQFGPIGFGWYYKPIRHWVEEANGESSAHVEIELYYKYNGEWSKPVSGIGGSMLLAKEKNGPHHSDEAYKMATTDALSVAMKEIGVGADVYMGLSDSKYDKNTAPPQPAKLADSGQRKTLEAYMKRFTQTNNVKAIDAVSEALANPELTEEEAAHLIARSKTTLGE